MWPIATRVAWSVCLSVCLFVTSVSPAKTDEPIEVPFTMWTRGGPRNYVLYGVTHWRHLANTTEWSVCGGDASNYFNHLLILLLPDIFRRIKCFHKALLQAPYSTDVCVLPAYANTWMYRGHCYCIWITITAEQNVAFGKSSVPI